MSLEDRLTQPQYIEMLRKVKEFARIGLSYTYVHGYKSHGYDHAENVAATLDKFLDCYHQYKQTLSEDAVCVLLMACYLHDIGMIIRNDKSYEEIRRNHNKLGWNYVKDLGDRIGIDPRLLNRVSDVCYAHSNFLDDKGKLVKTLEHKLSEHISIQPSNRNLGAILRVANMFALKINPLALIPQGIYFQKDTPDKDEWLMRKKMTEISFAEPGEVSINVNWNVDSSTTLLDIYRVKVSFCRLVNDLQAYLDETHPYLPREINLKRITTNLDEYPRSLDGQQHNMISLIAGSVQKGNAWLLDQKEDAWGTLKGNRPRVATTAKSIVGLLDHANPQDTQIFRKQIQDSFEWALEQFDPVKGGFPAKTLERYSTSIIHCTAMAVYAYALLCDRGILQHDENSPNAKMMRQAVDWLLKAKQPDGWGNWEGQPVRPLPSYWSLRALQKIAPYIALKRPLNYPRELAAFTRFFELQKAHKSESLATACFFLILFAELPITPGENPALEKLAQENIKLLFSRRTGDNGLWSDEIEQFSIIEDNEVVLTTNWTHHITALAIHALSANKHFLEGLDDRMELLYESILALLNKQEVEGNFDSVQPNTANKITPTYESLNTLHKALENLYLVG